MTAKVDIRDSRKRSDGQPASVVYAISQLVLTQLGPFFDEDGAAIPEARDDFVVGYVMHMTQLVLTRRQFFVGGVSKDDPRLVAKLVLEDIFGQRDREHVLQLWGALAQEPTQGSRAAQRCAERDMGRLNSALDEVPMGLRSRILLKLIEGGAV